MPQRRKVVLRPSADRELRELYDFIADRDGLDRAGTYIDRIERFVVGLDMFSERGTRRDDLGRGLRTIGFERRVTVVFRVLDDGVEILHVAYGGRDLVALINEDN